MYMLLLLYFWIMTPSTCKLYTNLRLHCAAI